MNMWSIRLYRWKSITNISQTCFVICCLRGIPSFEPKYGNVWAFFIYLRMTLRPIHNLFSLDTNSGAKINTNNEYRVNKTYKWDCRDDTKSPFEGSSIRWEEHWKVNIEEIQATELLGRKKKLGSRNFYFKGNCIAFVVHFLLPNYYFAISYLKL